MEWTDDIGTAKPGELIAFDFEISTQNETLKAAAVSKIKKEVAAHPLLDYQSGKLTDGLMNTETMQEVAILRVLAKVRKTAKNDPPEEIQEANIGYIAIALIGAVAGIGTYVVLKDASRFIGAMTGTQTTDDLPAGGLGILPVLVAVLVAWWLMRK